MHAWPNFSLLSFGSRSSSLSPPPSPLSDFSLTTLNVTLVWQAIIAWWNRIGWHGMAWLGAMQCIGGDCVSPFSRSLRRIRMHAWVRLFVWLSFFKSLLFCAHMFFARRWCRQRWLKSFSPLKNTKVSLFSCYLLHISDDVSGCDVAQLSFVWLLSLPNLHGVMMVGKWLEIVVRLPYCTGLDSFSNLPKTNLALDVASRIGL